MAATIDHHISSGERKWVRDVAVASILFKVLTAVDPQVPSAAEGLDDVVIE